MYSAWVRSGEQTATASIPESRNSSKSLCVWSDDDFEFFIDPTMSQRWFWRFFQNFAGTRFTSKPIGWEDNLYNPDYESAIAVGDDFWAIEMKIPWGVFASQINSVSGNVEGGHLTGELPQSGDRWGVNVCRNRQQSHPSRVQWTGVTAFPYDPTRFGILEFE